MKLELCAEIYSYDVIIAAAKAFANISNISVKKTDKLFVCTFANPQRNIDITLIFKEFENYVIDLMNHHGQESDKDENN